MTTPKVRQLMIAVSGADLSIEIMDLLKRAEIHTNLGYPSMFSLTFHDEGLDLVESGEFPLGTQVIISTGDPDDETGRSINEIMSGELTAIEPDFNEGVTAALTIRGYDYTHKLNREVKTETFINIKDSEIVSKIAGQVGLATQIETTPQVREHVFQNGQTDLAFLHMLARRNGYEVFVDREKLFFRKPSGKLGTVTLEWGVDLKEFHPRLSAANQVNKVIVHGWDPEKKKAIVGQAISSSISPSIGYGKWGGEAAQSAFRGAATSLEVRRPVATQAEADVLAKAILDQINSRFVEAEGVVVGNPDLVAGKLVDLKKIGDTFSGKYIVTSATHVYTKEYYETIFTVEGGRHHLMTDYIEGTTGVHEMSTYWNGIVPAIVTNNEDPKKWGRVKVMFPWLSVDHESDWARLVATAAGKNRGLFWLPEIDDEVMVAFEHGDFSRPYVLGAVWNGKDAIPESDSVKSGKVNLRTIMSRSGHIVRLDDTESKEKVEIISKTGQVIRLDDTSGSEKVEIVDKSGSEKLTFDVSKKKIELVSGGDINITGTGNVTIKSTGKLSLQATQDVEIKGMNVKVSADVSLELKGMASGKLEASGTLNIKGAMVMIN